MSFLKYFTVEDRGIRLVFKGPLSARQELLIMKSVYPEVHKAAVKIERDIQRAKRLRRPRDV